MDVFQSYPEKAPIYTMGSADVRAYSRNKRGIAGNLVWINFDRHALLNLFQRALGTFVADADEIRPQFSSAANGIAVFQSSVVRDLGPSISSTIDQLDEITITNSSADKELATPWYADQILPFDITLTGANEYGAMCAAKIFGVEILNEGTGISIDDAVSEAAATFVARTVEPMSAVPSPFQPRDFRPSPRLGTIENHYRLRGNDSHFPPINRALARCTPLAMSSRPGLASAPALAKTAPPHRKLRHASSTLARETAPPGLWGSGFLFLCPVGIWNGAGRVVLAGSRWLRFKRRRSHATGSCPC